MRPGGDLCHAGLGGAAAYLVRLPQLIGPCGPVTQFNLPGNVYPLERRDTSESPYPGNR